MMKSLFRATTPKDQPQLIAFLARVFSVSSQAESLRPNLLQWKFWAPREDYSEPRSYVLERNGEIVAHAGIWPVVLQTQAETARGCHMIDWASDPSAPGSGVALVQRLCEMFDFVYSIGGSEMTQRILPAFGFKEIGQAWSAARPLRPLQQMFSHQYLNWKIPARFVRNVVWSLVPLGTGHNEWTIKAESLNEPEDNLQLPQALPCAFRPNAFYRYLQSCTVAQIKSFELQKDGHNEGRIALSSLCNQVRVLGVWLNHWSPEGTQAAYSLAQQVARRIDSAFEIVAVGSTPASEKAAVSAGLRVRKRTPIYLLRRETNLPSMPFEFQIADNDAAFLSEGRPAFLT